MQRIQGAVNLSHLTSSRSTGVGRERGFCLFPLYDVCNSGACSSVLSDRRFLKKTVESMDGGLLLEVTLKCLGGGLGRS